MWGADREKGAAAALPFGWGWRGGARQRQRAPRGHAKEAARGGASPRSAEKRKKKLTMSSESAARSVTKSDVGLTCVCAGERGLVVLSRGRASQPEDERALEGGGGAKKGAKRQKTPDWIALGARAKAPKLTSARSLPSCSATIERTSSRTCGFSERGEEGGRRRG